MSTATIEFVATRFDPIDLLHAGAELARRPACPGHGKDQPKCIECRLGRSYLWSDLARDVRCDSATPKQWVARGGLADYEADKYATRLGLGPELVWPDYTLRCLADDELTGAFDDADD